MTLHLKTEQLWEYLVADVLRGAVPVVHTSRDSQISAPRPWVKRGTTARQTKPEENRPDYMIRVGAETLIADAKYKNKATVGSSDGYQLFAYSHLAMLDQQPSDRSALIFPGSPSDPASVQTWDRYPDYEYTLTAITIPFPSQDDVRSRTTWRRYLAEAGRSLREMLAYP